MLLPQNNKQRVFLFLVIFLLGVASCTPGSTPGLPATPTPTSTDPPTAAPSPTLSPTIAPTAPPTPTIEPTPLPDYEPAGCLKPVDDYSRVEVNGVILNQRTLTMLQYAQQIYGGKIDLANRAITQGSYTSAEPASFGTHNYGGAVDFSVRVVHGGAILYHEIEPAIRALRAAGFAAWLREPGELSEDSPIHIHAIAIGDKELSWAAQEQLTGNFGYFLGFSGIPQTDGIPVLDPHGGPVVCNWMKDLGYGDLREDPSQSIPQWTQPGWQEKLRLAAENYISPSAESAIQCARSIDFMEGETETASLMCGPLAAVLWRDAGLLPIITGPAHDIHNYWLADPKVDGAPWTFFPPQDYTLYHFDTPINKFDFFSFPLRPGDFFYTYAGKMGYDHMFVVTEVDETGRAYTVSNTPVEDHLFIIDRLLLYDPNDPKAGAFQNEWVSRWKIGTTGLGGFDILRPNGISLPRGDRYTYIVRPGDTLPLIAARFDSRTDSILELNHLTDPGHLQVGDALVIPVNLSQPSTGANPPLSLDDRFQEILQIAPPGDWAVTYKNLHTGEIVSFRGDQVLHAASTIKLAVGMVFFAWLEQHPETRLDENTGSSDRRTHEQLLEAMLVKSEEDATDLLLQFLDRQPGFSIVNTLQNWGIHHTTLEPRRTTAADLVRLMEILYLGEGFSEASRNRLIAWLQQPSANDDLRLGGGLPGWVRPAMAHKPGLVFENGWGVVADVGLLEWNDSAYAIAVISNQVDWNDFELAMSMISRFSQAAFRYATR